MLRPFDDIQTEIWGSLLSLKAKQSHRHWVSEQEKCLC